MGKLSPREARLRRHVRVRAKIKGTSSRPRLAVFRALNHIYTQVIDDVNGTTLASASTTDPELKEATSGKNKKEQATEVGRLTAKRAQEKGITEVVFDRGGYRYQGRVQALAEAARQGGLKF